MGREVIDLLKRKLDKKGMFHLAGVYWNAPSGCQGSRFLASFCWKHMGCEGHGTRRASGEWALRDSISFKP